MTSTTGPKPVESMNVAELRAELEEQGAAIPKSAKQADLAALVAQARAAGEEIVVEPTEAELAEMEEERRAAARALPAVRVSEALVARDEITPAEVAGQRDKIRQVMDAVMQEGVHYGKVPGVSKPTLLKPGAELLAVTFRFAPHYDSERVFHEDGHLTVVSKATLTHIPTQLVIAEGEGLCTSREKKYAVRRGDKTCPDCGHPALVRSTKKKAYYCIGDKGGCGHRFNFGTEKAKEIDAQEVGDVPNPNLADVHNTVLKMANKRALVAAILNGTAASDIFTQDVEDGGGAGDPYGGEQRGPFPERRAETEWNAPKSWAELADRMKSRLGEDEAPIWMAQAVEVATGNPDRENLTRAEREYAWQKLCGVLAAIEDGGVDLQFAPRSETQQVFARFLDGQVLAGPAWALTGEEAEEGRPQKGQATIDGGEVGAATAEEDDIPF